MWVFIAQIDKALRCTRRVSRDGHAFNHGKGIIIQNGSIFETTGFAFIGITDNRFGFAAGICNRPPFNPSGEPRTAASSQFTLMYMLNDIGWIHLGDGSPENGHSYSNSSVGDHGVNLSPEGALTGQAYAANVGWITFEQGHGKPALNLLTGTLSGFAYSANLGWIVLDT